MIERLSPAIHAALLLLLCGVLYFPYLGAAPFFDKGEPREAMAVQDIVRRGEWLVPLKRATDVPSKPPLFHWSAAAVYHVTGRLDEATIRFPSALYATLGVLLVYFLARKLFNAETGLCAGAILATSLVYQDQALDARVDMTLCFFVILSLALFYSLCLGFLRRPIWYYFFFAVTGIGALAKGPLGILLPALVAAAFATAKRRWDWLAKFLFHPGIVLMLVLAAGWYALAVARGGEGFFDRQILQENLSRFVGGSGHSHPIYYYIPYLFSQGLPWALLLPVVLWSAFRKGPSSDAMLFFKIWFAVMFVFFSISLGKRPVYLLPLYPALAILTAHWLVHHRGAGGGVPYYYRAVALFAGFTGVTLLLVVIGDLWNHDPALLFGAIEPLLKPKDRANFTVIKNAVAAFGWPFTAAALASALLWLSLARCLWTQRVRATVPRFVLIAVVFSFVARGLVVPKMAEARSYRPFMFEVDRLVKPEGRLYLYGRSFNSDPVVFYHGEPVESLDVPAAEIAAKIGRGGDAYLIMAEGEWLEILKRNANLPPPLLKSNGKGPEGDAPLVLVRAQGL
jgi:4-amino-4-deoxy-L-arabinose transferase-like glycosyltransferase